MKIPQPAAIEAEEWRRREKLAVWTVILTLCLFDALLFAKSLVLYNSHQFVIIHAFLAFFSLAVSFSIVLQGWLMLPHTMSVHRLRTAALFAAVGTLDMLHMFNFPGMFAPGRINLSMWLWLAARLAEAGGLLLIYVPADRMIRPKRRYALLACSFLAAVGTAALLAFYRDRLPAVYVQDKGVTALKTAVEYGVVGLRAAMIAVLTGHYLKNKTTSALTLIKALVFLFLGELYFALMHHYNDNFSLFGYMFNALGYYGLLKGVYMATIEEPYARQKAIERELLSTKLQLEESQQRYKSLFEYNPNLVFSVDLDGNFVSSNAVCKQVTGYDGEHIDSLRFGHIVHPDDRISAIRYFQKSVQGRPQHYETRIIHKEGRIILLSIINVPIVVNGKIVGVYGIADDITHIRKEEEKINHLAFHDELTGLPNRRRFQELLQAQLKQAEAQHAKLAVVFLDIDRFKNLNDSLGHGFGDQVLQQVAKRLLGQAPPGAVISRMGGDEFTILLPCIASDRELQKACGEILDTFRNPFVIRKLEYHLTPSVGIALYPRDGQDADALMKNADIAMYRAKERRNRYEFYSPDMNALIHENFIMENDLRKALSKKEFFLVYQPQIESRTGGLIGVEALLRWNHPYKGVIPPKQFIPLAEDTGFIIPLGEWVFREACRQAKGWHDLGLAQLKIAVNLSMRQFYQHDLIDHLQLIVRETGIEPSLLEIEITESVTMDVDYAADKLRKIKNLGMSVCIDDFGTGYSSLNYLKKLPIDKLKIDRSFVRDIATDESDAAIVATITSMARHLALDVIAEGVESPEQIEFLHRNRCYKAQGYYFHEPLTGEQFAQSFFSEPPALGV